jgi:Baseplate J-like protein
MVSSLPTYQNLLQAMINDMQQGTAYWGYNNGLGIPIVPGSEIYLRFSTIAGQLAVQDQMMLTLVNNNLITTSSGTNLDVVAANFGLTRRGATNSSGFVQLISSIPITLQVGSVLTGPNSIQYQVSQYGVYNPGQNVPITSVSTGSATNLPIGSIMNWQVAQANMQSTCLVSIAITGGVDAEDDATLRNRLYLALQSPAGMGNGQDLVTLAGSIDGVIQQAFVYSNFNGAGTQLVALAGYQTSSYIGRDIPHLLSDGLVKPYGVSKLQPGLLLQPVTNGPYNQWSTPGYGDGDAGSYGQNLSNDTSAIYGQLPGAVANVFATVITTVNNTPSDIASVLTLPYPVGSATNGYGGGWLDSTPWPNPDGYFLNEVPQVVSVQGTGTVITGGQTGVAGFGITIVAPSSGLIHNVGSPAASFTAYNNNTPTAGNTHIQWVNRSDYQDTGWIVISATILDFKDNGNDSWQLVLDTPLTFGTDGYDFYGNTQVAVGDYIFPASTNAQNYLSGIMFQYSLLGPGQATASQGLLTLGAARYPAANAQFPTIMGVQVEKYLETTFNEVYNAVVSPSTGQAWNTAFTPPAVNAPPNIFVPENIGFFPSEFWGFGANGSING